MTAAPPERRNEEEEVVVSEVEAKQGRKGRPVLYVLIASLILGAIFIVALNILGTYDVFDDPAPGVEQGAPENN